MGEVINPTSFLALEKELEKLVKLVHEVGMSK